MVLATAPFFTASLRFIYAVFVVLTIFAMLAYEAVGGRLIRVVFWTLIALNFTMGFAILEKSYQAHTAWGGELTQRQYRERLFPAYSLFAHITSVVPHGEKILLVGEARNYYLKRPYQLSSALDYCIVKKYLPGSRDAREFAAAIKADGYSYLAVCLSELERLQKGYAILTDAEKEKLLRFLQNMSPVFSHGSSRLYSLR